MKIQLLILFTIVISQNVFSQKIDYEAFKGEPVNIVLEVPMKKVGFTWYNKPNLSEKGKLPVRTIEDRDNMDYASSPKALLTKVYHAQSKKDFENLVADKQYVKNFKIKKVKDYSKNHFISEYQLLVRHEGSKVVLLKYSEIADGKKIGEHTLQAIYDEEWKVTEIEELNDLEFVIRSLDADRFLDFYRTMESTDEDINELRKKVRSPAPENRINLNKLAIVLKEVEQSNTKLWSKLTK